LRSGLDIHFSWTFFLATYWGGKSYDKVFGFWTAAYNKILAMDNIKK
jgi:hypothetical protein